MQKVQQEVWCLATLKELREAAFLTQADVAERLHLSLATISNWERGTKAPRLRTIPQLAALYGVTPQQVREAIKKD